MTQDNDEAARSAPPRRPAKAEGKSMAGGVIIGLLAVAAFGGGMWFAYKEGYKAGAKHAPKMVAADASPTKTVPENSGGLKVPHQDKSVYGVLGQGSAPSEGVTIRQASEEPVAKPEATAEAPKSNGVGKPVQLFPPQPAAPKAAEPAVTAAASPQASTEAAPPMQVAVAAPAPSAGPAPSTGGGWRLQLASLKSEEAVQKSWADLQRKHQDILGSLRSDVVRVDLGADKGIYFRLMAGPVASREEANAKCEQLKAQKVACLVARN